MYPVSLMQKKKEERVEGLKKTAIFLSKVSSIITSKRFSAWYNQQDSRFDWAGDALFSKLRKDLTFQVRQAMPDRDLRNADDMTRMLYIAERSDALVNWIEEHFSEVKVLKKEKSFTVPKGEKFADHLYQFLSRTYHSGMVKDTRGDFYLWNAIEALIIFARARDTLDNPIPNQAFEKVLSGVTEQFMLDGYPHDLLAHDAVDIRRGRPLKALVVRNEYCSTWLVKDGEDIPDVTDSKVYTLNKSARRAA
jgi:hypothetical protein